MRAHGLGLDQWIEKNREFVAEALRAMPVVNQPCDTCGVLVVRSCLKDRIVCGGCEFKERCAKGLDLDAMRRRADEALARSTRTVRSSRRRPEYLRLRPYRPLWWTRVA